MDHYSVRRGGAQADLLRGEALTHPEPVAVVELEVAELNQVGQDVAGVAGVAEALVCPEWQLEGGAGHVAAQDRQIVRIDQCVLGAAAKKIFGVRDDVLIQSAGRSHQHGQGNCAAATGAAGLLPRTGDGTRKAGQHGCIEPADVDPKLQRVGSDHSLDAAFAQAALDLAPLFGQIAAAVAAD